MKDAQFVLAEKVPGLAVLISMPVGPASAHALAAGLQSTTLEQGLGGNPELGAACAAAAGRIRGKLQGSGLKTSRAASVAFGVHGGFFCVGVVTDKTPARVKAIVKAVLSETSKVSPAEIKRATVGMGEASAQAAEMASALCRGAADATVLVCGPLPKAEKQKAAIDKAKEGAAAAGVAKPTGSAPRGAPGAEMANRCAIPAAGVALVVLCELVAGSLKLGGAIVGDSVEIPRKNKTAAGNAGANKDKKTRLLATLSKPGETARALWSACAQAVHVRPSVPSPKEIADAVFAALSK